MNVTGDNGNPRLPAQRRGRLRVPLRPRRRHRRPRVGRAVAGQLGRRSGVDGNDLGRLEVFP